MQKLKPEILSSGFLHVTVTFNHQPEPRMDKDGNLMEFVIPSWQHQVDDFGEQRLSANNTTFFTFFGPNGGLEGEVICKYDEQPSIRNIKA